MKIVLNDKSPGLTCGKQCIHCLADITAGSLFFHFPCVILSDITHQINIVTVCDEE